MQLRLGPRGGSRDEKQPQNDIVILLRLLTCTFVIKIFLNLSLNKTKNKHPLRVFLGIGESCYCLPAVQFRGTLFFLGLAFIKDIQSLHGRAQLGLHIEGHV